MHAIIIFDPLTVHISLVFMTKLSILEAEAQLYLLLVCMEEAKKA